MKYDGDMYMDNKLTWLVGILSHSRDILLFYRPILYLFVKVKETPLSALLSRAKFLTCFCFEYSLSIGLARLGMIMDSKYIIFVLKCEQ